MNYTIGHTAMFVTDMKKALDFYVNGLGFTHAFSLDQNGKPWIEYLKICDGQFLELFYLEKERVGGNAYHHLCLCVPDCEAAVKELEARGVKIRTYPRQGTDTNIQAWIDDPDGNAIEIMEIRPTSPQAKA